jgi:hypothetical protein
MWRLTTEISCCGMFRFADWESFWVQKVPMPCGLEHGSNGDRYW